MFQHFYFYSTLARSVLAACAGVSEMFGSSLACSSLANTLLLDHTTVYPFQTHLREMPQAESPSAVDTEKGLRLTTPINRRYKPSPDEEACHYLWNTYIGQAQDYDKALLEGWKGDMDGMVIFSALYSAVLTALLVESYQKLQEDPADATVAILIQVSQQLALLSNGTAFTFESRPPFELETAYVVCNTFWFLALALALTCSLFATFVQQWRSPVAQARVLAFLYFGLRRFGMHTFVDVIPILLHISLLFFFAGLVAFLQPINRLLTYLMSLTLYGGWETGYMVSAYDVVRFQYKALV
ncbi:hypothetical protein K435DRAFT_790801 [Dendrothele bispora CBS 962.96]|uniref:DUF6535 domain-containing protein n=2 Tax=Dendrothele bispora (strain CBS 962.96) TaxID=1314807 RepID=A0A4S8MPV0_DENBC|nr:hypothetical protein K435DRAFT_790801 [Dendrothele bispora CBS 962.96]